MRRHVSGVATNCSPAQEAAKILQDKGFRVDLDLRNEKIGFKIREHTLQKVPYLLVVGDREVEDRALAVRTRDGKDLGTLSLDALVEHLQEKVDSRS